MTVVISYTADRPSSCVETSPKERKQFCNNDFEEHLFYNQDIFCDGFFLSLVLNPITLWKSYYIYWKLMEINF